MVTMPRSPAPSRALPIPPRWAYDETALQAVEQTVVYAEAARRDDPDTPNRCLIRFLGEGDIDMVESLNRLVLARLPHPHILREERRDYFARHIAERGRCVGAFCGPLMIAFTVLSFPRDDPDNLGLDLGLERDQRLRACHFELSGVHPDYRGNHLHRTMNDLRARFAGAAGYNHLFGTVSPRNPYSLSNHLAAGMVIRKLTIKYGGMDRYIIYRDFRHLTVLSGAVTNAAVYRDCLDIDGQRQLLVNGYWGIGVDKGMGGEWRVAFVPCSLVDQHGETDTAVTP